MIQLHEDQLRVFVKAWRHWNGTQWQWSVQVGEAPDENFTGTAGTRRAAVRRAKRHAKSFVKRMVIVKIETEEYMEP